MDSVATPAATTAHDDDEATTSPNVTDTTAGADHTDEPQDDNKDTSPLTLSTESDFTAVTLPSSSEEWQVVDIPSQESNQHVQEAQAQPQPLGSKAQKWKDRLAKKTHKSSSAAAATEETAVETEEVQHETESVPMTTLEPNVDAPPAAGEGTNHPGDSETTAPTKDETHEIPDTTTDKTTPDETPTDSTDPVLVPNQEETQDNNDADAPSNAEAPMAGEDSPVDESEENQRNQPMSLQATYQEIAEAKRKKEEAARLEAEKRAEDERLAKEAERLESIARLEEERKRLRLEEQRKAQQELQQQQQQTPLPPVTSTSAAPSPTVAPLSTTSTTTSSKTMVVLVSKSFGTVAQRTSQDRAITSLKGQGIPYDEVDGSDPTLKDLRNDLFAISGIRGSYPQFFIRDGDQVTFLGDSDAFEYMNESGTLSQYFPLAPSAPTPAVASTAPSATAVNAPVTTTAKSLDTPTTTNTSGNKTILVLVSKSFGTMTQRTSQERAITTLRAKGIPCEEVDGSDPALKDQRNQLFSISGLRGQYPQFFVKEDGDDTITFLGDFETFETLNETGQLATVTATTAVAKEPSTSRDISSEEAPGDVPSSSNKLMIVLVSKSFGTLAQKTNQERAITMLKGNKIPFDEVDGSNPALHDLRNSLFAISGIRGNYPQFFLKENDQISFVGDFEAFEALNDAGTLASSFVTETSTPEIPPPPPPATPMTRSKKLIALVSKSFATVALTTNQDRAFTMLRNKNIPFEEVDGSDPEKKEQRNALFDISGIRGKYPQFFIQDEQATTFLGDLDVLQSMNDNGTLSISLLMTPSTEASSDRTTSRSIAFSAAGRQEAWTSQDSNMVPQESFENEFNGDDDLISRSTSRTASVDSLRVPNESFENEFDGTEDSATPLIVRRKAVRANSEDSDMIPNESFEDEFDSPVATRTKIRLGRKSPDELFENEFDPIDEEETTKDAPDEADDDDEDRKDFSSTSTILHIYLPMAIGVLGVAVIVGMWLSGQRGGGPHSPHIQ